MSGRVNKTTGRKRRRGGAKWAFGGVAFVIALLYWEQVALLYVISVLALCGLLLVVAFSKLERGDGTAGVSSQDEKEAEAGPVGATNALSPHTRSGETEATGRGLRAADVPQRGRRAGGTIEQRTDLAIHSG